MKATIDYINQNKERFLDELFEFFFRLEEIMNTVDFAFARLARSGRNRILDVRKILDDQILEGGLACAASGTHNE